jgi:DNA modification methylase
MQIIEYPDGKLVCADNLEWSQQQPNDSVDMVFGSPPYEAQRTYNELNFDLKGDEWVSWLVKRWAEWQRISRGVVAMVVEGYTENFKYSAAPLLLGAALHKAGFNLRRPLFYQRYGVAGTGGPDWLACVCEYIICTTKPGKLPWSDNTAMGESCKYGPGGSPTNRRRDGSRTAGQEYKPPEKANPGNIIYCGAVGGGHMGCKIAEEGLAPFSESLAEAMVRTFCPPGGVVVDPFVGTGTTISVARQYSRKWVGIDMRPSEIEKCVRRLQNASIKKGLDL